LLLCTRSDFKLNEESPYSSSGASSSKKLHIEAYFNADVDETIDYFTEDDASVETANENNTNDVDTKQEAELQIAGVKTFARPLQAQFDNDDLVELLANNSMDDVEVISTTPERSCNYLASLITLLENRVVKSDQFFLVV
jgi:hypothetical protein